MDNNAVLCAAAIFKQLTQGVALYVRQVFFTQQWVTECQPGGYPIFAHQIHNIFGVLHAKTCAAAQGPINGADGAPVVKIFSVMIEQRQEHAVQPIKFKQPRQMIICHAGLWDILYFIVHLAFLCAPLPVWFFNCFILASFSAESKAGSKKAGSCFSSLPAQM